MGKRSYQSSVQSRKTSRKNVTGARGSINSSKLYRAATRASGRTWPYQKPGMSLVWDPFPSKTTAMLRYNATVDLVVSQGGVPATYLFRANSIFDPDQSGIGHQPYGHDTYAGIYNHYKVNYATIVVSALDSNPGMLGCTITDDTTVSGDFDTIKEVKGTRMIPINNPGTNEGKVVQYFNRNQIFDPTVDGTGANFGSNPSEQAYFHVWFTNRNTSATGTTSVNVSIVYNVTMWELKDLGQS